MGVVIGLGSGRSGTKSLATLLDAQQGACVFHEANPSSMAWTGTESTVYSLMRDFEAALTGGYRCATIDRVVPDRTGPLQKLRTMPEVRLIGDVASYYLPYIDFILEHWPDTRFVCLRRDRSETIDSFARKLHNKPKGRRRFFQPKPKPYNHWLPKLSRDWERDRIWDRCFPKFDLPAGSEVEEYIALYYDHYYEMSGDLEERYPDCFRVFELDCLSNAEKQAEMLDFCDPTVPHVLVDAHANKGVSAQPKK